jgi:hypothetical protein
MLCVDESSWTRDISGFVLNHLINKTREKITSGEMLLMDDECLSTFFNHKTLLSHHINKLNVMSSLMVSVIRYIYDALPALIILPPFMEFFCQVNRHENRLIAGQVTLAQMSYT